MPETAGSRREWAENATTNPLKFACPDPTAHETAGLEWSSGVGGAQCDECGRITIVQGCDPDYMGEPTRYICRGCYERWEDDDDDA